MNTAKAKALNGWSLLLKQFCLYVGGAILIKLIAIVSNIYILYWLKPVEFGALALLNSLILILPIILGLGLKQTLALEFYATPHCWQLLWDITLITLGSIFFFGSMTLCYLSYWSSPLPILWLVLTFTIGGLTCFTDLYWQQLRLQNQAQALIRLQSLQALIVVGITFGLTGWCNLGLIGILWAQLIGQLVSVLWLIRHLKQISFKEFKWPNLDKIKHYLKIGLPFVPNLLLAWLIIANNRWLLSYYQPLATIGIYALAETIALLFQNLITQPLISTFVPFGLNQLHSHPNQMAILSQQYQCWSVMLILTSIVLLPVYYLVGQPILQLILPANYYAALPLLGPLIVAQAIFAASHLGSLPLQYLKRTNWLALSMLTAATVGIGTNCLLIPKLGPTSCLLSTNLAYLTYWLCVGWHKHLA